MGRGAQEDGTSDVVAGDEVSGGTLEADLALLEEDGALADFRGDVEALLDHDQGDACGMDPPHDLDQLADDNGRQAEGHLVDAQHLRIEQKRLRDGDLLLLTTREGARLLPTARRQRREGLVDDLAPFLLVRLVAGRR